MFITGLQTRGAWAHHQFVNRWWWILVPVSALTLIAAVNWQSISFSIAAASAETRPTLLRDAKWNHPDSAREFQAAFRRGSPEASLRDWLRANDFEVNGVKLRASKRVRGLPCNERVLIEWTRGEKATIGKAHAIVSEAGCL